MLTKSSFHVLFLIACILLGAPCAAQDLTQNARTWASEIKNTPSQFATVRLVINSEAHVVLVELRSSPREDRLFYAQLKLNQHDQKPNFTSLLQASTASKALIADFRMCLAKITIKLVPEPTLTLHDDGLCICSTSAYGNSISVLGSLSEFPELEKQLIKILPPKFITNNMQRWLKQ